MSKRTIWIIVVIALIMIVGSVIFLYSAKSGNNTKTEDSNSIKLIDSSGNPTSELSNTPNTDFTDLKTSTNNFNEIDSTIDYIG